MWVMILKLRTAKPHTYTLYFTFNALYVGDDFETWESLPAEQRSELPFNALYVGDDFETGTKIQGYIRVSGVFQCPLCG